MREERRQAIVMVRTVSRSALMAKTDLLDMAAINLRLVVFGGPIQEDLLLVCLKSKLRINQNREMGYYLSSSYRLGVLVRNILSSVTHCCPTAFVILKYHYICQDVLIAKNIAQSDTFSAASLWLNPMACASRSACLQMA